MILLDTNAVLWLHTGHRRGHRLTGHAGRLYASPASLLEIQMLVEVGRLRLRGGATVSALVDDGRWLMDDPPALLWFERGNRSGVGQVAGRKYSRFGGRIAYL